MISQEGDSLLELVQREESTLRWSPRASYTVGFIISDFVAIMLAFVVAYALRFQTADVPDEMMRPLTDYLPLAILTAVASLLFFGLERLYDHPRQMSMGRQLYGIFSGTSMAVFLAMAVMFLAKEYTVSRLFFILSWAAAVAILFLSRLGLHQLLMHLQARGIGVERLLIVGTTDIALSLARTVCHHPSMGYKLIALDNALEVGANGDDVGGPAIVDRIDTIIREQRVDEVIVALPSGSYQKASEILRCCRRNKVRMKVVPEFFDLALSHVDLEEIRDIPLISFRLSALSDWHEALKRLVDLCLVVPSLLLLAPLFALVSLAIMIDSPGPVLYKQTRMGRNGRLFQIYKFRSMFRDADRKLAELREFNECSGPIFKMRQDPRITRVGKWIRRLSIDELPQLFNVLQGHMSLVGPRPPLPDEVQEYEAWQLRRLEATPGITGLWQISGRSNLSFSDMVKLDLYYIDNWSLGLDMTILARTIPTVLTAHGAY